MRGCVGGNRVRKGEGKYGTWREAGWYLEGAAGLRCSEGGEKLRHFKGGGENTLFWGGERKCGICFLGGG